MEAFKRAVEIATTKKMDKLRKHELDMINSDPKRRLLSNEPGIFHFKEEISDEKYENFMKSSNLYYTNK